MVFALGPRATAAGYTSVSKSLVIETAAGGKIYEYEAKLDRITFALQAKFEHGQITFNKDEDWTEVKKQLSMFPSPTSKDDRIDALAYIAQIATVTFASHYEEVEHEVLDTYIGY